MSKVTQLHGGDHRVGKLAELLIECIDENTPDDVLLVAVIGVLEVVKQHYIESCLDG